MNDHDFEMRSSTFLGRQNFTNMRQISIIIRSLSAGSIAALITDALKTGTSKNVNGSRHKPICAYLMRTKHM